MTWAELVHSYNMTIFEAAEQCDEEYQKLYCAQLQKIQERTFNMESLARIATALEKIAGMDTEVNADEYLENTVTD